MSKTRATKVPPFRLRELMELRAVNGSELARVCGWHRQWASARLAASSPPTMATLSRVYGTLGCTSLDALVPLRPRPLSECVSDRWPGQPVVGVWRLRRVLAQRQLPVVEFARMAGLSRAHAWNLVNPEVTGASLRTAVRCARALGCLSLDELIEMSPAVQ